MNNALEMLIGIPLFLVAFYILCCAAMASIPPEVSGLHQATFAGRLAAGLLKLPRYLAKQMQEAGGLGAYARESVAEVAREVMPPTLPPEEDKRGALSEVEP